MPIPRCWLLALLGIVSASARAGEPVLEYNRDIRPILAEHCFKCHGPDSAARKAELRLDQREAAVESLAFVPSKPDESESLRRIFSTDPAEQMPPPDQPKQLTAEQKERLRRWVAAGAEYQKHWSFLPPQRAAPPAVMNRGWVRNPIDAFVLARLEQLGLQPAPEADRAALARRLSLDLRGLPPDPAEVASFVQDSAPDAYEKYVDRLLESPKWGEHRGRYWLDAARYADTHGIHFDNYREMWIYRDWVIQAFNRNLPFDQFTIEQLAGDLLPDRSLDQQIASGFNRCNMTTNEGGIINEEYLVLYTRDRTETVSQVWLGLTMNCTTCHDHKFDPISQREFYELAAYFNNTTQDAKDGNIKDTPPILVVPSAADRSRWEALQKELPSAQQRVADRKRAARSAFEAWQATATADVLAGKLPQDGLHLHVPLNEGQGMSVQVHGLEAGLALTFDEPSASWQSGPAGSRALQLNQGVGALPNAGNFERHQPFSCAAWLYVPANDSSGAIASRMDTANAYRGWDFWLERRRVGMHIIHQWGDNAIKVVSRQQLPANKWVHVAVAYDGSSSAAGVQIYIDGKRQDTQVQADKLTDSIRTEVPFRIGRRTGSDPLSGVSVQDLRVYERALAAGETAVLAQASQLAQILAKAADKRSDAERDELYDWWLTTSDDEFRRLSAESARLEREQNDIRARGTIAHVMQEKNEDAMAYVLFRGEYDKRRDPVQPDTPDILPPMSSDSPRNRLGLARWLMQDDHPLTARVTVNRFWQELFGTGIVGTTGDFGVSGELPTHQELLDWLAVDFRESGWDVKRLFKLIVMSNTYRQAALTTPEKREKDPANRWLSRGPRFRMDAEMIRDYALSVSGLLSPTIGGPSVKPYQPEGVWEAIAMNVSNTRSYVPDKGEGLYRRSLYTFWKRQAPPALMEILNAPSREFCVVRRERTNTPLQALATLNDPQFVEAARHTAQRVLREKADVPGPDSAKDEARLNTLASFLLSRPFRSDELAIVQKSLADLTSYYTAHPDDATRLLAVGESKTDAGPDAARLAAWTMLANELLNLDEVLCK